MTWFRIGTGRKLAAGIALSATLLHVLFLSLHLATSAAHALGSAQAATRAFPICGPAAAENVLAGRFGEGGESVPAEQPQELACPYCTSPAPAPAVILPNLVALPASAQNANSPPAPRRQIGPAPRNDRAANRSRAPPRSG